MKAEIKKYNGVPTLFLNGKSQVFMGYCSYFPKKKYYEDFAKGEGHSYIVTTSLSGRWVSGSMEDEVADYGVPIWKGPKEYDFSTMDGKVKEILDADPGAYIILRIYLDSPRWWDKKYPEEMCLWGNGKKFRASISSEVWRKETSETLQRIIKYVSTLEYSKHIIGYFITGQGTEEWYYHNGPDYSLPMKKTFEKYLKNKYETIEKLNISWNSNFNLFSDSSIPKEEELKRKGEHLTFRSLKKERKVIDYYYFASEIMAETVCYFAKIVKKETNYNLLCGTFYGYAGRAAPASMGTCAIENILKCPDIDFVTTPTCYIESRRIGTPWPSQGIVDSTTLSGKLWLNESDITTHLSRNFYVIPGFCSPNHSRYGKQVTRFNGYPTEKEGITALRKNFCWALSKGVELYWFDLVTGYYDSSVYQEEFTKFRNILQESLALERSSTSKVAIIVDPFAGAYMNSFSNHLLIKTVETQRILLSQSGAPFDEFFTFDMENIDIDQYKIIFFLSTWRFNQKKREIIEKRFKNNKRTLVWVYAAGVYNEKEFSEKNISDITGIKMKIENIEAPLRIYLSNRDHPLTRYLPGGINFGTEFPCGPLIYSVDKEAERLGSLVYEGLTSTSTGFGKAGWVKKDFKDWKSIYFASPAIPSIILRKLIKEAGAHIYNNRDDILYANKNFISVFAHEAGVREIKLPGTYDVKEVFSERKIGKNINSFIDKFTEGEQKLYQLKQEKLTAEETEFTENK